MKNVFSRIVSLLLVFIMMLSLVACGSKSSGNTAGASGSSETAAAETITIGLVCPVTGNLAEYGKAFQAAAEIACKDINEAGGINGREITFVVGDSKSDPKESTETARKMVSNDAVVAVIGDYSSSACMAAAPVYEEAIWSSSVLPATTVTLALWVPISLVSWAFPPMLPLISLSISSPVIWAPPAWHFSIATMRRGIPL